MTDTTKSKREFFVLIVEQDPDTLRYFALRIRDFGYSPIQAATAKELMEIATSKRDAINLILMDSPVDGITGEEFVEALRALDIHTRVMLLVDNPLAGKGFRGTVLMKPINTTQTKALSDALEQEMQRQQEADGRPMGG